MVLDYHYTYFVKFQDKPFRNKETFILRPIKRELQKNTEVELNDEVFLEIFDAIFECKIAAPLGWAKLSLMQPIHRVLITHGIESENDYHKSMQICNFFSHVLYSNNFERT